MLGAREARKVVDDIDPINHPTDASLGSFSAYRRLIESPVRAAVERLNALGITTISSSANSEDIGTNGHLSLVYDGLTDGNRSVADGLVAAGNAYVSRRFGRGVLVIEFPVSSGESAGDIESRV